jgi:2-dehydropantoate 2-reductase
MTVIRRPYARDGLNSGVRFVVLGAGAVGCTVGGRLADAGHDVTLVARGAHAEALRRDGLRLAMPDQVLQIHVPVVDDAARLECDADTALLLATKTQDTLGLLDRLPRRDAPVFCLQNGVANERMALRRFADVYGVVVMLPAVYLEPGRVDAQGTPYSGLLDVGRYPVGIDDHTESVAGALSGSGFVSQQQEFVMRWKYAKLLRNLGNALEALCGHDLSEADMAEVMAMDAEARGEAVECYRAAGIDWVSDDEWAAHRGTQVELAPVEGRGRPGGSTWQSLTRGLTSQEGDYLNGEIALLGRRHGVPTPVNVLLQEQVAALCRSGAEPGSMRPADLRRLLAG